MAKQVSDSVLDAALALIDGATEMFITDTEPANRAAAVTASLIGTHSISGSFTIGAGTPDGRQITTPEQADVAITTSGNVNHVCLGDGSNLLLVTTTSAQQAISQGGTVTIPAFVYRIAAPT